MVLFNRIFLSCVDSSTITQEELNVAMLRLNDRLRKKLGLLMAIEVSFN